MTADRLTLSQIATSSLAAARVLEGYGIDYCTGAGRSLAEVCAERGLEVASIADDLAIAHDEPPDEQDWTTQPLPDLMAFLAADHRTIRSELATLRTRLERLAPVHTDLYPGLEHLPKVFADLCDELDVHMAHEEHDVFPAIQRHVEAGEKGAPLKGSPLSAFGGPLRMMEIEHESYAGALRLMREFAQNYAIPQHACPAYEMLVRGMAALEVRLSRHVYLENNVLFPRAVALKPARTETPA